MKFLRSSSKMLPVLQVLAVLVVALLLAGCTGTAGGEATSSPSATPGAAAANTHAPTHTAVIATQTPAPAAEATQTPAPTQGQTFPDSGEVQAIRFEPGTVNAEISGRLDAGALKRYLFSAQKGQIVTVELTVTDPDTAEGLSASVTVTGADGTLLTTEPTTRWKGTILTSQVYTIDVQSLTQAAVSFKLLLAIPVVGSTPYVPLPDTLCQSFQETAAQALNIPIQMEVAAPFLDEITGEAGKGCALTGSATGAIFESPAQAAGVLKLAFLGFTELPAYQADGPTGTATALTRDSAVLLIRVNWEPAPGTNCLTDQPISGCNLKPEEKLYTISIQGAMK